MKILGIESSCDDTCAAIVEDGTHILSNVVASQINIFATYGGVIPEIAARSHLEAILPVIDRALSDASCTWNDIDAIAVTHTPGLMGSLMIGTLTARTLAILHDKPLYPVHHLKSHIYANWLIEEKQAAALGIPEVLSGATRSSRASISCATPATAGGRDNGDRKELLEFHPEPSFPLLALVISGGHTQIIYMPAHNHFEIIGTTLDDAVGECFDKIAKILGLPYPGGPSISKLAKTGDRKKYSFPHPHTDSPLDFSFSGLKTAVLRTIQRECGVGLDYPSYELQHLLSDQQKADFAASFEQTAIDILLKKLNKALELYPDVQSVVFAGGVSANEYLRKNATALGIPEVLSGATRRLRPSISCATPATASGRDNGDRKELLEFRPQFYFPSPRLSGDNAAMVASACYFEIQSGVTPADPYHIDISPRTSIENYSA